jgi:hypothetical protein
MTDESMSSPQANTFAIILADQKVIPLTELPDHCPRRRGGKRLNVATAYRWALGGCKAKDGSIVRLPIIKVGGTQCTSTEAFQWFCDRLSAEVGQAPPPTPSATRTSAARRRAIEAAERELDRWLYPNGRKPKD